MNNQNLSYCIVASIFIGASIYTMLSCKTCSPFRDYEQSLNQQQLQIYRKIINERQKIYITGLIIGIVVAIGYMYMIGLTNDQLKHSCIFVAIAMTIQYFYYTLAPKSMNMVNILDNKEQISKWLNVYNHMKYRYHLGMILGLIGYFLFSYGAMNF